MTRDIKSVNDWVREITAWGKTKGWDKPALCKKVGYRTGSGVAPPLGVNVERVLAKVALCHTELSEAVEEAREDRWIEWGPTGAKPEGFVVELADTVIRIFHLAGLLGLDLEGAIEVKMAHNTKRAYRHGGKRA